MPPETVTESDVREALVDYVVRNSLTLRGGRPAVPLDESLIRVGLFDSFGIIELVAFLEATWKVEITEEDFTVEKMGSINKMAQLITRKRSP